MKLTAANDYSCCIRTSSSSCELHYLVCRDYAGSGSNRRNRPSSVECSSLYDKGENPRALELDESLLEVGVASLTRTGRTEGHEIITRIEPMFPAID